MNEDPAEHLRRIDTELKELRESLSLMRQEIAGLHRALEARIDPVEALLSQNGFSILAHGDRTQVILPAGGSDAQTERFYESMRRYSFRLFLRDLIQNPNGEDLSRLVRYCSEKTVRSYLKSLAEMGIVETSPDGNYRMRRGSVPSFGPTLEWYVCDVFRREFLAPALFNVRFRNTRYGGDYDVISLVAGQLAYVEVKSSPPRGVELQAVDAFLKRLLVLRPQVAVFLVDTELRMKDKIVPLFEEAMRKSPEDENRPVVRLENEIFHIGHRIYLINSRKGIYSNLRRCFRDFMVRDRKSAAPADHTPD